MIRSPVRWAGSKYSILSQIISAMPNSYATYIDPMVGGGSLFINLQPKHSIINDLNPDLINFYLVIKNHRSDFIKLLTQIKASKKKYYEIRNTHYDCNILNAVRFLFLNRLCWNGLYRVNGNGLFNVPFGGRIPKNMWNYDNIDLLNKSLFHSIILNDDFETTEEYISKNDFVFIDPPYPKNDQTSLGFNRYTSKKFVISDHKRLSEFIARIKKKAKIMLIISGDKRIINKYYDLKIRNEITTKSLISSKSESRILIKEYILTSY